MVIHMVRAHRQDMPLIERYAVVRAPAEPGDHVAVLEVGTHNARIRVVDIVSIREDSYTTVKLVPERLPAAG